MHVDIPAAAPILKNPPVTRRSVFMVKLWCFLRFLAVFAVSGLGMWLLVLHFRQFLLPYAPFIRFYSRPPRVFVLVGFILLSFYFVLLVHESGHALCARLLRYRLLAYVAGPLKIEYKRRHYRVVLNKTLKIFEGYVSALPLDARHLRRREILVSAGGPLANLVQTVGCLICLFLPELNLSFPMIWFLRLTALIAFLSFLSNCLPLRSCDGSRYDGAALLFLLKGGASIERWWATEKLQLAVTEGKLPREWDATLIQKAIGSPDGSPEDLYGCAFAYCRALEEGDSAGARGFLERQLSRSHKMSAAERRWLALEAAYFEARYHHNAQAARAWLRQAKRVGKGHCARFRAEAAVLLAENEKEKARICIEKGLRATEDVVLLGAELLEKRWLQDLAEAVSLGE